MPPCHAHFQESFSSDLRTIKVVGVVYISNNTLSFLNVIILLDSWTFLDLLVLAVFLKLFSLAL